MREIWRKQVAHAGTLLWHRMSDVRSKKHPYKSKQGKCFKNKEGMMKKKVMAVLLTSVMAAASLVGCGSSGSGSAADTSADSSEAAAEDTAQTAAAAEAQTSQASGDGTVSLRFMWWGGDDRATATLNAIDAYEKKNPNVTIEAEYGSSDGYQEKLTTQLASGTIADIFQMGTGWMRGYVNSNADYFVDFNGYPDDIDLSTFDADFLKNNGQFDGHQYGLPTGISGHALIYNKDLADKIGIDFSQDYTWDDLIDMGKKVQEYDSSMYLLTMGSSELNTFIIRPYLQQLTGKTLLDNDTKQMNVTEEDMAQVLNYIKELYDNNVITPITNVITYGTDLGTDPNWINQKYVGAFCYSSTSETLAAACPDATFSAGKLPVMENAKDDGWYANCAQYFCVSKNSANVEEALKLLNYFYNDPEAAEILGMVRSIPATSVGQDALSKNGTLEGIAKDTVDIVQEYKGTNDLGLTTEEQVTKILEDAGTQIAYAQETPENVAANTMQLLQNFLDSQQ